jgi:LDH2 family malate/lactate/ureidoglycolate dehydrogenase
VAVLVPGTELESLIGECFEGVGLPATDARAVAEVLVDANLRGIDSHGFQRLPIYMRRVKAGLAGGTAQLRESARFGPLCRIDARHALGPAAAVKAIAIAIELARTHGIGLVAVGGSTHFGPAGFYARRAARERLIGIVLTNGPKNMAPHGASERFLGTCALAIAAPLGRQEDFCIDMSLSGGARGKILRAHALGEPIEAGLAIDAAGNPTTDAAAALAGSVLAVGGAKGSGLALAIDILAAALGGAEFACEMAPMYGPLDRPQNVGHVFIAVDPARLSDPDTTSTRLEQLVERLHSLRPAAGFDLVRYPGEGGAARAAQRRVSGIPLEGAEIQDAACACDECGLSDLAERLRGLLQRSASAPATP